MALKKRKFTPESGNVDTYEMSMEKNKVEHGEQHINSDVKAKNQMN